MSAKTNADVLLGGKVYTLSGYESEEYLQKVASYINSKIGEFDKIENYKRLTPDMKSTLLHLNIADDYFKAKQQAERLEKELEQRAKEIYELQHELITHKVKSENFETSLKELEVENKDLLLKKTKLETSLEDFLLDKEPRYPKNKKQN